jgi:hypothetical protein
MSTARNGGLVLAAGIGLAALAAGCGGSSGVQTPSNQVPPAPLCPSTDPVALTVKNILGRCAVEVAGSAASTAVAQTLCVPSGTVPLSTTPRPGAILPPTPWHDTDADHGNGDPGTVSQPGPVSATTITAAAGTNPCVWTCCTLPDGTGCPASNQCP